VTRIGIRRRLGEEDDMTGVSARAVLFDRYGGRDVLYVAEVPMPKPAADEVVVAVKAAGINPGETAIRSGALAERFPASFPSGEGSDLAGLVVAVGDGVDEFAVDDAVLGFSWSRSSHATHVTVPVSQLIHKPPELSWEVAGSLYVVGCTAYAAVRAVDLNPGETVAVSAAAGGVGTVVVQLLALRDATILGIASPSNADWLRSHGVVPVSYGEGLAERLKATAPEAIDAFIDLFGPEYVQLAVDLGIPRHRIETIASYEKAEELGVKSDGSVTASTPQVLSEMAGLVASGAIEIPIAGTYPLDQVADAFEELEHRHTRGKIVLIP
jgi:NADPH2:quinone reductase